MLCWTNRNFLQICFWEMFVTLFLLRLVVRDCMISEKISNYRKLIKLIYKRIIFRIRENDILAGHASKKLALI